MVSAKSIIVKSINAKNARAFVRFHHYSGKVQPNSQLHFGVFLNDRLHGVMQLGPSIDKRRMQGLVQNTKWHEFIELNRMAFDDALPRNSESRALSVLIRLIRKHYPQIKWMISFADGCQCGDGTIYRAAGFTLIDIKKNVNQLLMPDGSVTAKKALDNDPNKNSRYWRERGAIPLSGFQLKYIYFLDPKYREFLTVPELPFSKIAEVGAGMYKGEKRVT
jgi:hypothetical protein